jgi:hypothetical protein
MSIIHRCATQSTGALMLRSNVGNGSTIKIWLSQIEAEGSASDKHVLPEHRTCTLRFVGDNPLVMTGAAAFPDDLTDLGTWLPSY